jgi:hypothetical protein
MNTLKVRPPGMASLTCLCGQGGLWALLMLGIAMAQDGPRDPMQPPPAMRPAPPTGGPVAAEPPALVARHLMVIDGVRYVIDNGRRRGVGDLLGGARIERIEDSAVVVRNGRQLQRLPLFAGVVKRAATDPAPTAITGTTTGARPADAATQTAQALAVCADRPSCMQRPGEPR